MNKNILNLIKNYHMFMDDILDDPDELVFSDLSNLSDLTPKTNDELKKLVRTLLERNHKNLNIIDVSNITDFSNIFEGLANETKDIDISKWDVSKGEYFIRMFKGCTMLTCDLSNWKLDSAVNCFEMFHGCKNITSEHIPQLTNMKLSEPIKYNVYGFFIYDVGCYLAMFELCSSLTEAPKLPATELTDRCYESMFEACASLTKAPELPALIMKVLCYKSMFLGCISLINAPELPSIKLAEKCYGSMFYNCLALQNPPELPATELAEDCYWYMFLGCSNLTEAPELPAVKLVGGCYDGMFLSCIRLKYIKAMYIIKGLPTKYMNDWVRFVEDDGTFIINKDLKFIKKGKSGIPAKWKIYTA